MTPADIISAAAHAGRIESVRIVGASESDVRERLHQLALLPDADLSAPDWRKVAEWRWYGGCVSFPRFTVTVATRMERVAVGEERAA